MCSLGGMAVIRKNRNRARKYTEKLFNAFLAMGLVLIGFTGTLVSLVSIHSLRANEIESGQKTADSVQQLCGYHPFLHKYDHAQLLFQPEVPAVFFVTIKRWTWIL